MPTLPEPMKASSGREVPAGDDWAYEIKYDGVRVIAHATPDDVRLVTRNGRDKAAQFPEVADALRDLAARAGTPLVLDGEVVALRDGEPARFQELQDRVHLKGAADIRAHVATDPAALFAFDLLIEGDESWMERPWTERRARLEKLLGRGGVRPSEIVAGPGEEAVERARAAGWEGVIAKRTGALYHPGARSRDWLKLKVEFRQEFVVGGWTEPRRTRKYLGALLLGYFTKEGELVYVGHTGTGFTRATLEDVHRRLSRLERATPAFAHPPRPNDAVHWVRPSMVVEVKFSEWTADRKLRTPVFLGIRDDKDAREVGLEERSVQRIRERGTGNREPGTGGTAGRRGMKPIL